MNVKSFKGIIKKIPIIGPVLIWVSNAVGYSQRKTKAYHFERIPIPLGPRETKGRAIQQIRNLLNYTKTSNTAYSADNFPGGYHSLNILGECLSGKRHPHERVKKIPIDFKGHTLLDIGSNQGGMLFELREQIRWGVGIDYDPRMINAANRIKEIEKCNHLQFYHFNLDKDPLELIEDFLPEPKVDIVFLFSVCMWIKNWRNVIRYTACISDMMVFESNGNIGEQAQQIHTVKTIYKRVEQLTSSSEDDPETKNRKLFLCHKF